MLTQIIDKIPTNTCTSGVERRGASGQHEKMVERMIALEGLMRPFAAGEEHTHERAVGALYHSKRLTRVNVKGHRDALSAPQPKSLRQSAGDEEMVKRMIALKSHKLELEPRAASATDKSKGRARASESEFERQSEGLQRLSQKVCTVSSFKNAWG